MDGHGGMLATTLLITSKGAAFSVKVFESCVSPRDPHFLLCFSSWRRCGKVHGLLLLFSWSVVPPASALVLAYTVSSRSFLTRVESTCGTLVSKLRGFSDGGGRVPDVLKPLEVDSLSSLTAGCCGCPSRGPSLGWRRVEGGLPSRRKSHLDL